MDSSSQEQSPITQEMRHQPPQPFGEGESDFRLLVDSLEDHAILLVDPEGTVRAWNRGAEHLFGWPAREMVGQPFTRVYAAAPAEGRAAFDHLEFAERQGKWEREGWRPRKEGGTFWGSIVVTALRDDVDRL